MNLLIASSGGRNLVIRPGARPTFYSSSTLQPAIVEVYWRFEDEPPAAARLIGRYQPGQQVGLPLTTNRNIILSTISVSAGGVRSVRDLRDAAELLLLVPASTGH